MRSITIGRRVESASSIKTHKQCPRKYYYSYVEALPSKPSIHLIRGSLVHEVLEEVYDGDWQGTSWDSCEQELIVKAQKLLIQKWRDNLGILSTVGLSQEELVECFEESLRMITSWAHRQALFLKTHQSLGTFQEAFKKLTPLREEEYSSEKLGVRGFIDAIITLPDGSVRILDYKTNKRSELSDHHLQLSLYALLYKERYGKLPDEVGIHFLRDGEQLVKATQEHITEAINAIEYIHSKTASNNSSDYSKNVTKLCSYCDYQKICFHGQTIEEYKKEFDIPLTLKEVE